MHVCNMHICIFTKFLQLSLLVFTSLSANIMYCLSAAFLFTHKRKNSRQHKRKSEKIFQFKHGDKTPSPKNNNALIQGECILRSC